MFSKLITIFICFNTIFGSRLYPKIFNNAEDNFLKLDGEAGSDDHGFDSSNSSQKKEIQFARKNCGIPKFEPNTLQKIIGGVEANPHSWPWQVSIQNYHEESFHHLCSGTIISTNKVLSAAHCFYRKDAPRIRFYRDWLVVAGMHNLHGIDRFQHSQTKRIQKISIPDSFNSSYDPNKPIFADIAIIHIKYPGYVFDIWIRPACLPTARVPDLSYCYATGFTNHQNFYRELHQVKIPTMSNDMCSSLYGSVIKSNMVCAGYLQGGRGICNGDSGGPLLCNHQGAWVVDGIVSLRKGCGKPREPGVYTRVFNFLYWIKSLD